MTSYSFLASEFDYAEVLTRDLILFFERTKKTHLDDMQSKKSSFFHIKYRNTSVLYSSFGYDAVYGGLELKTVEAYNLKWLVSPFPFLDATSLRPIKFETFQVSNFNYDEIKKSDSNVDVTVIIPIYGSPRNTFEICQQIKAFSDELRGINGRVIISVDGHEHENQASQHRELLSVLDRSVVTVFEQSENIGFIRNVNFLYRKTPKDSIVILLTSDVRMQDGALRRIISPLLNYSDIALSTPLAINGENLEAPDCPALHWHDIDKLIRQIPPIYPDAETNVGYLLAVDRRKYTALHLFDDFFENGYGDDSDLYYRCVNLGFRGVVADNCCVFHEHGASFDSTGKRSYYQRENQLRFIERWGEIFHDRYKVAASRLAELKTRQSKFVSVLLKTLPKPQIVFLLPTNDVRIGGVKAVFDLVDALNNYGVLSAIICLTSPLNEAGCAQRSVNYSWVEKRDAILSSASLLLATSHDTCEIVKMKGAEYKLKTGYFVQGPEFSFSDGKFLSSVLTGYHEFDHIFVVSQYLKEVIGSHVETPITIVPYGPPVGKYYNLDMQREAKSIAVQLNGNPNKGSAYVAGVIASLVRHGYRFYSFGDEALRDKTTNFCYHLGFLSTAEKVRLFNKVEFYLDASNYEGLGLLLMESIHCGAIPIYRHNGGTAELLKSAGVGIQAGDYAGIGDIKQKLSTYRESNDYIVQRNLCLQAIKHHSLESATDAMLEWWNAQR